MRPDAPFVEQLRRFRRRAILVVAVDALLLAGASFGVVTEILLLSRTATWPRIALAGFTALAAIATLSWRMTPDLRQTARWVDARAALDNVLTSALEFLADSDEVSAWIVRDAARRLQGLAPRSLFPVRLSIGTRSMMATLVIGAIAVSATGSGVADVRLVRRTAGRGIADAAGTASTSQTRLVRDTQDPATAAAPSADSTSTTAGTSATGSAASLDDAYQAGGNGGVGSGGRRADVSGASQGANDNTAGGSGTGVRQGTNGHGAAAAPSTASRAPAPSADTTPRSADWKDAELAIAQDRIPLRLRATVRRYFAVAPPRDTQ